LYITEEDSIRRVETYEKYTLLHHSQGGQLFHPSRSNTSEGSTGIYYTRL